MSYLLTLMILLVTTDFTQRGTNKPPPEQTINPIVGDAGFLKKFGHLPDAATDEKLRIATHLEYVENILRAKDCTLLPTELRQQREKMLDLLHQYRVAGVFPVNYDYKDERRPCFIDRNERICAVGYLVEESAGREVAEAINRKYKYAYISEMNGPEVEKWIAESGLTREECAMIQPTYDFERERIDWEPKFATLSLEPLLHSKIYGTEWRLTAISDLRGDSLTRIAVPDDIVITLTFTEAGIRGSCNGQEYTASYWGSHNDDFSLPLLFSEITPPGNPEDPGSIETLFKTALCDNFQHYYNHSTDGSLMLYNQMILSFVRADTLSQTVEPNAAGK